MKTSNRILLSFLAYLLLVVLVSAILLVPYTMAQKEPASRIAAAGTVDCAIFGASHGLRGIDPSVLQEELGWSSYNYSNVLLKEKAKLYLAKKELARNPVKTVILDLTFNTLTRDQENENGEGDAATVRCLDSIAEQFRFLLGCVDMDVMLHVYGRQMIGALNYWQAILRGEEYAAPGTAASNRGFYAMEQSDVTIAPEELADLYHYEAIVGELQPKTAAQFAQLVNYCRDQGARVIVLTLPVSDSLIWTSPDMDSFREMALQQLEALDVEFYDLNLLKNRNDLFSDDACFQDVAHLSEEGSRIAMQAFADLIRRVDSGEDVSSLFFNTYAQVEAQLPYASRCPEALS